MRYLAGKHDKNGVLEPKDAKQRALASQWMDWQLSVVGPAITPAFWGLIRTPPEKRDAAAIKASQEKTTDAMKMLDAQLAKTAYVAGPAFSYGDIPVGVMCYRYRQLVPGRPATPNLDRWYDAISKRKAFQDHVGSVSADVTSRVASQKQLYASPRSSFGTSPVKPAASRMNTRLSAGMRSTTPRPRSRTSRSTSERLENNRFKPSVATPMVMVSKRRQR